MPDTTKAKEASRTQVAMPRETVDEIDRLVGKRRRSAFVLRAVEEHLERARQRAALEELKRRGGAINLNDHPEWRTPEDISRWVRDLRALDNRPIDLPFEDKAPEST